MIPQTVVTKTLYAQLQEEASAYSVALFDEVIKGSAYKTRSGIADFYEVFAGAA